MAQGRPTTIFRQLVFNVVFPTLFAILILAAYNFYRTRRILVNHSEEKSRLLTNEITKILKFQDAAFRLIDEEVDSRLRKFSDILVSEYFSNTVNIEKLYLRDIADRIGMDPENEDIYIIRRDGVVVNTTFKADYGINLFDYGDNFKNYLLDIFRNSDFVTELFAIEGRTKRPRKYTYQPTPDRKYIIELGAYSEKADEIINIIEEIKKEIKNESKDIIDLELFLFADRPFTMNREAMVVPGHDSILLSAFMKRDTVLVEKDEGRWLRYQYIFLERSESSLYKGSVIRIISDVTSSKALFRKEALLFIAVFGITLLIVALLIYRKTRIITRPIIKLVENVDRITSGDLRERAEVTGNNEITKLTERFNMMIAQLGSYYFELEEKVNERTFRIEKQKEEIEEQKKHIMDSIHYAKRIQNAILPSFSLISSHLKNYFVLYLPKDVVSGDFYWVHEADGLIMVAAVDCTGHGVPGAFMSIVGYNQLNHAVSVKRARTASLILDELNRGVITTLNESASETAIKDGMDMALCILDLKRKKAQYAGANNPLCLVRDGGLIKYKADRFPIGIFEGRAPQAFTNNEFDIREGDIVYLFSDGYADQFGGPENKKFMSRRFEELLAEISSKPMEVQQEILLKRFASWKGSNYQVDDILVIGIRI
jgi:serine phosphatase RsbU (regulator of sigma subunit)